MRGLGFLLFFLLLAGGILYALTHWSYSQGQRAGTVSKFSHRGYLFKTWEGSLNVGGFSGETGSLTPQYFDFSVKDEAVAQQITEAVKTGGRVTLHYEEKVVRLPWNGETKYFITHAEPLNNPNRGAFNVPPVAPIDTLTVSRWDTSALERQRSLGRPSDSVLNADSTRRPDSSTQPTSTDSRILTAQQGSVVRWPGNCKRCSMGERSWEAVNGTCYYPIDMERKADTYSIVRRTTGGKLETAQVRVVEVPCKEENFDNFPKTEYVNVSETNQARHRREMAQLNPLLDYKKDERPAVFDLPLGKPANPLPSSEKNFGACRSFNGQPRDRHTGLDYGVAAGKSIMSVANGRVIIAANHFFSGNTVFIDHGNGLISEYMHLKSIDVKPNQTVTKGQKIGTVGETGRTTGPHLHLGIRWHGARIDPSLLLNDPAQLPAVSQTTTASASLR